MKIKQIETIKEPGAAFGKPQKIRESYRDPTGQYIPLKETIFAYDTKGCETERKVYDSKGNHCYTTTKKYDDRLRLIEESNPLGEITRTQYDESDNKIEEELGQKRIHYDYDHGNRLIKKTEYHDHGELYITTYTYNSLDQLTTETDPYGQTTTHTYDRLGNRKECINPPSRATEQSTLRPRPKIITY
jgi:YD repeat-containing protein